MPDGRHSYFTKTIEALTGFECRTLKEADTDTITSFLDDPSEMVLRAILSEGGDLQLSLLTDGSADDEAGRVAEVRAEYPARPPRVRGCRRGPPGATAEPACASPAPSLGDERHRRSKRARPVRTIAESEAEEDRR